MKLATCHGCLAVYLATDDKPRPDCTPCNEPDKRRDVTNSHGALIKRYNAAGQLVYRAAAADRCEQVGTLGRAGDFSADPMTMHLPHLSGPGMFGGGS